MQPETEVFDRLGSEGLTRVLDDLLDQTRLARLATACGLTYPGIRTRSQRRERILADLVAKAAAEEAARKKIFRTLSKETFAEVRAWGRLDPQERERRMQDPRYLLVERRLGLHLFMLAGSRNRPGDDDQLQRLIALRGAPPPAPEGPAAPPPAAEAEMRRELARLEKRDVEARKKLGHLEHQLARARETEKRLKKDLIQRKGELAEARMLAERLQREKGSAAKAPEPARPPEGGPEHSAADGEALAKAVRRLATEQRGLAHALERAIAAPPPPAPPAEALKALGDAIEKLREQGEQIRKERAQGGRELLRRLKELHDEVRSLRQTARPGPQAGERKGSAGRVGVFIDVQNVYYGARQLKGKLDFDALLQAAVRDRRLVQALAYVVESGEIDQSGFIAMLQQRAITVRRKTLKVRSDGSMKGDWDMEMALDILDAAPTLDVVVLVSGDGDFTSLVKRVKSMGPRVEVVGFPRNTAKSLLEAADRFQPLDRKFMIHPPEEIEPPAEPGPAATPPRSRTAAPRSS